MGFLPTLRAIAAFYLLPTCGSLWLMGKTQQFKQENIPVRSCMAAIREILDTWCFWEDFFLYIFERNQWCYILDGACQWTTWPVQSKLETLSSLVFVVLRSSFIKDIAVQYWRRKILALRMLSTHPLCSQGCIYRIFLKIYMRTFIIPLNKL